MLRVHGLQVALALIVAGSATEAVAQQKKSPPTTRLFNGASGQAPSNNIGETLGMRPETVGAVVRVPLSVAATSSLTAQNNEPRRLEVALPGGRSITCEVRPV